MKKISKKFLAALAACALAACVALPAAFAEDDAEEALKGINDAGATKVEVSVEPNKDVKVKEIAAKGEKTKLTAGVPEEDADLVASWQWQILADAQNEIWVNISGETGKKVELTYGMVRNLLNENDQAKVRAQAFDAEGEVIGTSFAVLVSIADEEATEEEQTEEESEEPVVLEEMEVADEQPAPMKLSSRAATVDASDTYDVVINYVFENNQVVADPYTANLAAGSNFSATITFPVIQGYLPYLNNEQVNSYNLSVSGINSDIIYNVVYKPTNVDYTVIHYLQNLNDDKYAEYEREVRQGLTDSEVSGVANDYPGFYALLYEEAKIAADGSTVVEVYYDRNYYLMNFDLGEDAYGTEPIYARYGADLGEVSDPTRAGYIFKGWSLNGSAATLPDTMPAENRTYTAIWEPEATAKVTVVFWGENANDEGYSYIKSSEINVKPGTSFTYSEDGTLVCSLEEHTHNNTCEYECGKTVHSHEASCYKLVCTQEEHAHSDSCARSCGKVAHAHNSDCYMNGAGLNSNLWAFVKSDTVTVAADGSTVMNVYYDRKVFTLTFKDGSSTVYTISEKWGSDISEHWPIVGTNGTTYDEGERWSPSGSSTYKQVLVYLAIMPAESFTLTVSRVNYDTFIMHYMVEAFDGESGVAYKEKTFKESFSVTANYSYVTEAEDFFDLEGFTQFGSYPSFSNGSLDINGGGDVYFYYTRNSYDLVFNDGYNDVKTESVKYEASLGTYENYVPEAPSVYEPGSVEFGGWYLNPECTGDEYKLSEHTMPAENVLLYAKWVPVTHDVRFYLDKTAFEANDELDTHPVVEDVPHGEKITVEDPENGSYNFVGWFYMDGDVEKAFDFNNMPIKKDMQVYGKWSSNVLKVYSVLYKIQGTNTEIAEATTGSALAGSTKTFDAKGGTDLYADYQEGYFPLVNSHSITLDVEDEENNTYTFWYVQKDAVPYTVKYLDAKTGEPVVDKATGKAVEDKVVSDNRKAVVTETFVPVNGYMPNAYQQRLIVDPVNSENNVIIFYYTEDTEHAYYKITHYTENVAGGWNEYNSSEAIGDIGKDYSAEPLSIDGYTFDPTVEGTVQSGTLTANGLELKLYYKLNSYPYQVRYLETGTGKVLAPPKDGTAKYSQVISESAIDIADYKPLDPTSQILNIRIEEDATAKLNIITFYYQEKTVQIDYKVVGPDGCGTVTPVSETLKVLSGTSQGSVAAPASNDYRFVGWFTDPACTQPVTDKDGQLSSDKFTPAKRTTTVDGVEAQRNVAATYYAKFEWNVTELTINKVLAQGTADPGQTFIFKVVGKDADNKNINLTVTLTADEKGAVPSVTIADLPVGNYQVTELTDWSWRYQPDVMTKDVNAEPSKENAVTFTNTKANDKWLDDDFAIPNIFEAVTDTTTN